MVYKFAKIIIVVIASIALASVLELVISDYSTSNITFGPDSWGSVLLMINYTFGWLIYAIPLAIIGFKIYPKQKTKAAKK